MRKKLVIWLVVALVLGGSGFFAWRVLKGKDANGAVKPDVIATGRVERGDVRLTVEGWGPLAAGEEKDVAPLSEGLVDRVLVKEGQEVKEGDPLLTLYNATLGMEVEKARLEVEQARLDLAKILGVLPEQVEGADPDLALAVRAPVTGRVAELKVKEGDQIGAKQDLLRLVDDSEVLVELYLDEGSARNVKVGQAAELQFHDFSGITPGRVSEVDPNRYPQGAAFMRRVVISVPNPGLLAPEMKAQVNIDTGASIVAGTGTATKWKEDTWVTSGVGGRLEKILVKEGSRVRAGEVLARLERSSALLDVYSKILGLQQARVELERKQEELAGLTLRAPLSGRVIEVNTAPGQKVEAGKTVVKLASYAKMTTEIMIDELDIVHVKPGMEATVRVDALPGKTFAARVVEVAAQGTQKEGIPGFPVKVEVLEPGELRAGMTANVSIFVDERRNVLTVPIEAVYEEGGQTFVQVVEAGQLREVPVKLGLQDRRVAEVLEGLSEGQVVVTGSSADQERFFGGPAGPGVTRSRAARLLP